VSDTFAGFAQPDITKGADFALSAELLTVSVAVTCDEAPGTVAPMDDTCVTGA
jgi:hypothetical protein